eukprot:9427369-Pyramimonas_sp.AAC.1
MVKPTVPDLPAFSGVDARNVPPKTPAGGILKTPAPKGALKTPGGKRLGFGLPPKTPASRMLPRKMITFEEGEEDPFGCGC